MLLNVSLDVVNKQVNNKEIFLPVDLTSCKKCGLRNCLRSEVEIFNFGLKMLELEVVPERSLGCESWEFILGL